MSNEAGDVNDRMEFGGTYTFNHLLAFDGLGNMAKYNASGNVTGGTSENQTHSFTLPDLVVE